MVRSVFYASVAAFALLQGAVADDGNHVSNKTPLFDGLDFDEGALLEALPSQKPSYVRKWEHGYIPNGCKVFAEDGNHCSLYDLEVYDVEYSDCNGNPWTFCRCTNATWEIDDMTEMLGRIPVKARQYTRIYTAFATNNSIGSAYTKGVDTILFDNVSKSIKNPTVALHENAHAMDGYWNQRHSAANTWVSADSGFIDAINTDTCVPDGYAKSNDIENFAQVVVLAHYDKNTGGLDKYATNSSCLAKQLAWVEEKVGETIQPGGKCDFTWARDHTVCMGPDADCSAMPAPTIVPQRRAAHEVPVLEVPEDLLPRKMVDHAEKMFPSRTIKARDVKRGARSSL